MKTLVKDPNAKDVFVEKTIADLEETVMKYKMLSEILGSEKRKWESTLNAINRKLNNPYKDPKVQAQTRVLHTMAKESLREVEVRRKKVGDLLEASNQLLTCSLSASQIINANNKLADLAMTSSTPTCKNVDGDLDKIRANAYGVVALLEIM